MKSFLQTNEWLEFQKEVGNKTRRFDNGKISANIIKLGLPLGKSMLYIPHGPDINFQDIKGGLKNDLNKFIQHLKDLAREEGSIMVKIEPLSDVIMELLHVKGMRRSSKQIQPYKTVVLDLGLPEDHLLGKMHPKTRYNIKVAEKHGIVIKPSVDIDTFFKLLKKTSKRDQFSSHPKPYYEKLRKLNGELKSDLFLAFKDDKPLAGAIILRHKEAGYYLHGASDHEYRNMMAPYALHWDIIKYLKDNGIKYYDFWGIDANKWPGVTRFKLGWGGDQKENPGSFDLVISRFWYLLYSIARKIL